MGTLRILSRSSEIFQDREEAGRLLAAELDEYRGQNPVVLGIPRGGVVVASELAGALDAEMDIVLAHKLPTPGYGELAMGAVSEDGKLFMNQDVLDMMRIPETYIQREKTRQLGELRRRAELFRRARPRIPLKDRIVIVTDDGVATGATTQAAIWAVKLEQPAKLVAAIPIGSEDTIRRLAKDVDEMLCLRCPPMFGAVGQFYRQFHPVEDEDVLAILQKNSHVISHTGR